MMVDILRRALKLGGVITACALVLYFMDIGCIIRFVTGVACPGCGLTRAWLCALHLDFAAALAFHPLFWLVPPVALAVVCYERTSRMPSVSSGARRVLAACLAAAVVLFIAVWLARLLDPADTSMLLGDAVPAGVPQDIVNIRWLS